MIKFSYAKIGGFSVQNHDQQSLVSATYRSFGQKMPLLYISLGLMLIIKIVVFWESSAPAWLSVGAPGLLALFAAIRGIRWIRLQNVSFSEEDARVGLRKASMLFVVSSAAMVAIDVGLYNYGTARQQDFIVLQHMVENICAFYFLMQLRKTAFAVSALGLGCLFYFCAILGGGGGFGAALSFAIIELAMIVVMIGYERDFASLIQSHIDLRRLGVENIRLANMDMVTGLANRREFFRELALAKEDADENSGTFAIGIVDLDGFKLVNDTHGHKVGDMVLAEVASRLQRTAGERATVFRLGGDEFVFIDRAGRDVDTVKSLTKDIISVVRTPISAGTLTTSVGCSIGVAFYPETADSVDILFERTDFALYEAKRSGRSRAVFFAPEHAELMSEQGAVEQALRNADFEAELGVVFQPIVDSARCSPVTVECLARWTSPSLGVVSPATFIPIAEQAGLISNITLAVLKKAIAAMDAWPSDTRVSINLSSHDIISEEIILQILESVGNSGVSAARLCFELTETAFIHNFEKAREHIEWIRAKGIGIALDDFGAGYSSLSHVHALPLDKLKVDRRFVVDVETNGVSQNIIRSVAALCRDLDIECIVEGAENLRQVEMLQTLGCNVVQGYYYAKPMANEALLEYLEGKNDIAAVA